MAQPGTVQPLTGPNAGTSVASVDANGNEVANGTSTAAALILTKQASAPAAVPGALVLYTPDGINLQFVAAALQAAGFSLAQINLVGATAGSTVLTADVTGDSVARLAVNAGGVINWGPGNGATDTNLYRGFAAGLQTDSALQVGGAQIAAAKNVLLGATTALGDNGVGELQMANATTPPSTNPTAGIDVYSVGGVLTYRNPQGLVNTIVGSQGGLVTAGITTVANTASETLLQGFSLPASDAIAGAVYRLRGWGVYSWTGTPTIQFTVRLGGTAGTVLAQMPAFTLGTAQTNAPFEYEVIMNFLSTTTAQTLMDMSLVSATASDAVSPPFVATPTAAVAVSLSTTKVLQLDVTWGTAAAGNTISLLGGYTERVA